MLSSHTRHRCIQSLFTGAALLTAIFTAPNAVARAVAPADEFDAAYRQANASLARLEVNLSNPAVAPGAVIASPSQTAPNYFFHWVRDAAIVMDIYVDLLNLQPAAAEARLEKWLDFESKLQTVNGLTGLGEPKFNVDGTAFLGPWARPQFDGPALRAHTMIRWANWLIDNGRMDFATARLTQSGGPIHTDLDAVMAHWSEPSFDVWEEVKGDHFFTRLAQMRALATGADLFARVGDNGYALLLQQAAQEIAQTLEMFWSSSQARVVPTLNQVEGLSGKTANLDSDVLIGSVYLLTGRPGDDFAIGDDRMFSTMKALRDSFSFYRINHGAAAPVLGRYPEDVYDGTGVSVGHPWFIATLAYTEAECQARHRIERAGALEVSALNRDFFAELLPSPQTLQIGQTLRAGDPAFNSILQGLQSSISAYFATVLYHAGRDGEIDEQFNRDDGYMRGAHDLSWSHAAYLRAYFACSDLL